MSHPRTPRTTLRAKQRARKWSLLVLAGLPLALLHGGLLLQRALHLETLDAWAILRWGLAIALLGVLKRLAPRARPLSPTLGIAAILIFAVIHLRVAAPEPSLPLAATGLGLALSLAVVERWSSALLLNSALTLALPGAAACFGLSTSRDGLKDRAPPRFA